MGGYSSLSPLSLQAAIEKESVLLICFSATCQLKRIINLIFKSKNKMFFPFTMNASVADSCHGSLELTMSPSFIFMSDRTFWRKRCPKSVVLFSLLFLACTAEAPLTCFSRFQQGIRSHCDLHPISDSLYTHFSLLV